MAIIPIKVLSPRLVFSPWHSIPHSAHSKPLPRWFMGLFKLKSHLLHFVFTAPFKGSFLAKIIGFISTWRGTGWLGGEVASWKNDSWRALCWLCSVLTSCCIRQCGHGFKLRKGACLEAAFWRRFVDGYTESHKINQRISPEHWTSFSISLQLQATRALFLLSIQGVLNRQRFLGFFPSFVNLRAVKGRDVFTQGNHSTTLLSSLLLFAIVILLFLLVLIYFYSLQKN